MIEIKVSRNASGFITSFLSEGHSGYAEAGSDIVCAVASTALQAVALGAEEVAGCKDCKLKIAEGYMKWSVEAHLDSQTEKAIGILTETMYLVLKQAQEAYPEYIHVFDIG